MSRKIYFAGSIRGGRDLASLYRKMIALIQETDDVLTEHIGDLSLSVLERGRDKDALIYQTDTAFLRSCDMVIAECTCPSLGVGYELAYAEALGKPVHIFYNRSSCELSAMLTGDPYFDISTYETEDELLGMLRSLLSLSGNQPCTL